MNDLLSAARRGKVRLAVLLAVLADALGGQSAPKFSHRAALKKPGRQCTGCHAAAAASTSTRGKRNLRFNHKLHLAMGNAAPAIAAAIDSGQYLSAPGDLRQRLNTKNACEACHRGLAQADVVTQANFPQMADCLVCQPDRGPV